MLGTGELELDWLVTAVNEAFGTNPFRLLTRKAREERVERWWGENRRGVWNWRLVKEEEGFCRTREAWESEGAAILGVCLCVSVLVGEGVRDVIERGRAAG